MFLFYAICRQVRVSLPANSRDLGEKEYTEMVSITTDREFINDYVVQNIKRHSASDYITCIF